MNQSNKILEALQRGDKITALDALSAFGCFRLAARIRDLRDDGHHIVTETIHSNGKQFARYHMEISA